MSGKGRKNPNFRHGKYAFGNYCKDCGVKIDGRSKRCVNCRMKVSNPFKGKKHTKQAKKIIGEKSKSKFTPEFIERVYRSRRRGKGHSDINGYILIKDYTHPNRNSHNDVLEHIKVMSDIIGRPLKKGEVVHHINFIRDDNRKSNLWLYKDRGEHGRVTKHIFGFVNELLKAKIIIFKNGEYKMNHRLLEEVGQMQFGGKV